jgi:TRAP-type C4-dicarboxylate transport system substrate-binding protein
MQHHKSFLILSLLAAALLLPGAPIATNAQSATTIRIASLAPPGSSFVKVLKAWGRTLEKETDGRVELRVFSGGSDGSDRALVKQIKAGKLDAAGVATTGLSMIAPELQVLAAPGLLADEDSLDRVRERLDDKLQGMIEAGGFTLLAWGDGGKNRVFATEEFSKPSDLERKAAWAGKDNAVQNAYVKALGAAPLRTKAAGVLPGLKGGSLDVVPASAMSAVAFQWYTQLKYMTSSNFNIIVGGSVISTKVFKKLNEADQKVLLDTAKRAASKLGQIVARDDDRAYETLLSRNITEVDTTANQAEWEAAAEKAREQLVKKGVFSKSLLQAVEAAAAP